MKSIKMILILISLTSLFSESFEGVEFSVLKRDSNTYGKLQLDIELNEEVENDFLKTLSIYMIKNEVFKYNDISIRYHLTGNNIRSVAWAKVDYNSKLDVNIVPVSQSLWGVKLGLNRSIFTSPDINKDSKIDYEYYGIKAGLFRKLQLNEYFSAQTELAFSMKGHKTSYAGSSVEQNDFYFSESTLRLDYIQFPIYFKFHPRYEGTTLPYLSSGVFAAYNINAKCDYKIEYLNGGVESSTYEIQNVNQMAYGLLFGAGIEAPYKNFIIEVDLSYEYGLSEIIDNSDYKINIWAFTLGIGYNR